MKIVLFLCLIPLLSHSILASGEDATDLDEDESQIMAVETTPEENNDNVENDDDIQPELTREEPNENNSRDRRQASFAINLSGIGSQNSAYWDDSDYNGWWQGGNPPYNWGNNNYNWGNNYWGSAGWPTNNYNQGGVQVGSLYQNSWTGYPSYGDWGSGYYDPYWSSGWENSGWNNVNIGGNQNVNWNNGGWQGNVGQTNWGGRILRRW